ncbi:Helix-turn-helix [Micromonospora echinofusca]|uniref:Helix-turn-helix n=1 Tax=Micromonospora echinofusca TaxID=47858 RepID=A0A1C5GHB8_MICEH|nr:helix-turn-helix domain-containing protein [Micromonospora echinofusca]SCG19221.1 Helix-turn-helix [Micromonospora echinofusca]
MPVQRTHVPARRVSGLQTNAPALPSVYRQRSAASTPVKASFDAPAGARSHLALADLRPTTTGTATATTTNPINERLRETLLSLGESPADFATKLGVDPKTVERWISNANRHPHPRTAYQAARLLDVDVTYLWPTIHGNRLSKISGTDELTACWPGRASVPLGLWTQLVTDAQRRITIMGDFGLPDLIVNLPRLLADKAAQGVQVRIIVADPHAATNPVDTARALAAEAIFAPLADHGVTIARYPGHLSTTILWVDDDLIVRTGIDGCPAAFAPIIHLRALPNGPLSRLYLTSLDAITENSVPVVTTTMSAVA